MYRSNSAEIDNGDYVLAEETSEGVRKGVGIWSSGKCFRVGILTDRVIDL